MTSMLHTLASTFTTCACGAKAQDCVLARIAEFVENQTPLTPSPSPPSQFAKEKHGAKGRGKAEHAEESPIDLGPLIGTERGFRTRERIPFSGGMGGVELVSPTPSEAGPSRLSGGARKVSFPEDLHSASKGKDRKGKSRAVEDDSDGETHTRGQSPACSLQAICDADVQQLAPAPGATLKGRRRWTLTARCQRRVSRRNYARRGSRRVPNGCASTSSSATGTSTWTRSLRQ